MTYFGDVFKIYAIVLSMRYRRVFEDGSSYFLTLVTYRRQPILVEYIEELREAFRYSKKNYDYRIDAIVVLPDHIHMIITPKISTQYPKIVSNIKRAFVYQVVGKGAKRNYLQDTKSSLSYAQYRRKHSGVWQERYYEHTIRNEKDWIEKIEYIKNNPIKHNLVEDITRWEYSSFYNR